MKAKQISDIQIAIEKKAKAKDSLYWYSDLILSEMEYNLLEDNAKLEYAKRCIPDPEHCGLTFHCKEVDRWVRFIPEELYILATNALCLNPNTGKVDSDFTGDVDRLAALFYGYLPYYNWKTTTKAVYTLSSGLATSFKEQLADSNDDAIMSFDSILHLPHANFFIDTRASGFKEYAGAFISISSYEDAIVIASSIWNIDKGATSSVMGRFIKEDDGLIHVHFDDEFNSKGTLSDIYKLILCVIAYMGSEDADVLPTVEKIAKPRNGKKSPSKETNRKDYQVGYRIGQKLDAARARYKYLSEHHDGSTKRPHIRKAHWHSFWVGKKNSDKRKIVVKWVAETYVNCETAEMVDIVDRLMDKQEA